MVEPLRKVHCIGYVAIYLIIIGAQHTYKLERTR